MPLTGQEIDWEATPDKDGPRQYAEMLVKETATLHKVLSKYLAASTVEVSHISPRAVCQLTVQGVLSEVLAAIVHRLSEEYAKVELKSDDAKKRMAQDVALMKDRLTPLSESGASISSLETLIKDKSTPRRPIGLTMRGMLNRVNSGSSKANDGRHEGEDVAEAEQTRTSGEEEDGLAVVEEPMEIEGTLPVDAPGIDDPAQPANDVGNGKEAQPATSPTDGPRSNGEEATVITPNGVERAEEGPPLAAVGIVNATDAEQPPAVPEKSDGVGQ
jgi:vacuolar protein sorting-associated protein 54